MSNKPNRKAPSSTKVAAAAASGGGRTPVWIWVAMAAVVVVAGILAVSLTSGSDGGDELLVFGEPTLGSEALPEMPAPGVADPAVGMLAPTVTGQALDGAELTIAGSGRPKVVMFLAHWCPHCQAEVPRLTEWIAENGRPEGVDLYAVATATDATRPNYPPGPWLQREEWPVSTLVDDEAGTAAIGYGLTGFPFFVAVDADGNVVQRASGELTIEQWEGLLQAAETGEPSAAVTGGVASPT